MQQHRRSRPWLGLPLGLFLAGLLALPLAACGGGSDSGGGAEGGGEVASSGGESGSSEAAPFGVEVEEGLRVGGQPTEAQLQAAAASGTGTVISLRAPTESGAEGEQQRVEALGMRFVSIPVSGPAELTAENAAALDTALAEAQGSPTILHYGSGNRAAALLAVRARIHGGLEPAAALELGRRAGLTRLEGAVEALLPTLEPIAGSGEGGETSEAP